jgi:hypothetical protein
MSRDHDWGCRLTLLVDEDDRDQVPPISRMLEDGRLGQPGRPGGTADGLPGLGRRRMTA